MGLASCATIIATLQDTIEAILWRIEDKAVQRLKEMTDNESTGDHDNDARSSSGRVSRSNRVAPNDKSQSEN